MQLKGSKTEKNLKYALIGESIARNRYTFFAEKARQEGNEEIAKFFETLAINEMSHARRWYELLHGEISSTLENLKEAAALEHEEWTKMYVQYAKDAQEEGFDEIASLFNSVKQIERIHEAEELKLINKLSDSHHTIDETHKSHAWICTHCGLMGSDEVDTCPFCQEEITYL